MQERVKRCEEMHIMQERVKRCVKKIRAHRPGSASWAYPKAKLCLPCRQAQPTVHTMQGMLTPTYNHGKKGAAPIGRVPCSRTEAPRHACEV